MKTDGVTTAEASSVDALSQPVTTNAGFAKGDEGATQALEVKKTKMRSQRVALTLTDRDRAIVRWVADVGVATREQVQAMWFTSGGRSRCQERLTKLFRHRFVDRVAGRRLNAPDIYYLSRRSINGVRLLRMERDDIKSRRVPSTKLHHTLDIVSCRVHVSRACTGGALSLQQWISEDDLRPALTRTGLLPDAYFQLSRTTTDGDRRSGFFLEVERSAKSERALKDKFRRYGEFYYKGHFKHAFGTDALRVLVLVAAEYGIRPERRVQTLVRIAEGVGVTFMRFVPLPEFLAVGAGQLWSAAIWSRPGQRERTALFKR
jgi:hypothetical protein